jgi:hypothetical protein
MTSISSIYSSANTLSLAAMLSQTAEEQSSILDTSSTAASAQQTIDTASAAKKAKSAYGLSATSGLGQQALKRALAEMNPYDTPITFADIAAYQKELEEDFTMRMRLAMQEEGVAMSIPFTLTMSQDGMIGVQCDDPVAKTKVQGYLDENPDACEQFGYIQALANLDRARQGPASALSAWQNARADMAQMRSEAVETFFSDALSTGMSYSSLTASFGALDADGMIPGSASYYAGISYTI